MSKKTDWLGVRVDPNLRKRLAARAKVERRAVADLARLYIEAGLDRDDRRGKRAR